MPSGILITVNRLVGRTPPLKKMIIVNRQWFIEWIESQPDDRMVDVDGVFLSSKVKDPMMQFAEEALLVTPNHASYNDWNNGKHGSEKKIIAIFEGSESGIQSLIDPIVGGRMTYEDFRSKDWESRKQEFLRYA